MALTITSVEIQSVPRTQPCPPPGKTFDVEVTIHGDATLNYDRYKVDVHSYEPPMVGITLDIKDNVVAPQGTFTVTHAFTLKCDDSCHVSGPLGTSAKRKSEVRATVRVLPAGASTLSPVVTLECQNPPGGRRLTVA